MEIIDYRTDYGMIGCEVHDDYGRITKDLSIRYRVVPSYYYFEKIPDLEMLVFRCGSKSIIPHMLNYNLDRALLEAISPVMLYV